MIQKLLLSEDREKKFHEVEKKLPSADFLRQETNMIFDLF